MMAKRLTRLLACVPLLAALIGCSTIDNLPQNTPLLDASTWAAQAVPLPAEHIIGLSFSGGGLRAAAFSYGVIQALTGVGPNRRDVYDEVALVTSVSGGSLTAAYMVLKGRAGLQSFRDDVLGQNLESNLRVSLSPRNLLRLFSGGLNDRSNLAQTLDEAVFKSATFADLFAKRHPAVWINATDLYNRTPFPFILPVFRGLCSDLRRLKVSEAVAASMAAPLLFAPVVLRTYPEHCQDAAPAWVAKGLLEPGSVTNGIVSAAARAMRNYRDPAHTRFVKLGDGGLSDNQGLASLMITRAVAGTDHGPLSDSDAVKLRRLLFLIVDAGRPTVGDWGLQQEGPSVIDVAVAALDASIDSATRLSATAFQRMMDDWRTSIVTYRCSLTSEQVRRIVPDRVDWRCDDLWFEVAILSAESLEPDRAKQMREMPTRLQLPAADIDAAIAAGRDAALAHDALRRYADARSRESSITPLRMQ